MAGILKREPSPDGRDADNFGYVNSVDEAYKLIAEFETGSRRSFLALRLTKVLETLLYIYIFESVTSR